MGTRRYELEVRQTTATGPKKYCVPGREPDTADTLESDGLIKQEGNNVVVLKPDDLRVIAWQLGANAAALSYAEHTIQELRKKSGYDDLALMMFVTDQCGKKVLSLPFWPGC